MQYQLQFNNSNFYPVLKITTTVKVIKADVKMHSKINYTIQKYGNYCEMTICYCTVRPKDDNLLLYSATKNDNLLSYSASQILQSVIV